MRNFAFKNVVRIIAASVFLCFFSTHSASAAWSDQFDTDGDGIFDTVESGKGTSPTVADTDGDGVSDGWEIGIPVDYFQTNWKGRRAAVVRYWDITIPQMFPSDTSHLGSFLLTPAGPSENPNNWDYPYQETLSPFRRDSDGDGLSDGLELSLKIGEGYPVDIMGNDYGDWLIFDPTNPDSDRDGVPDAVEYRMGLHHFDYAQVDGYKDFDGDYLTDYDEIYVYQTDPFSEDTDGDGFIDSTEISLGLDPNNPDTDGDGYKDSEEGGGRLYASERFTVTMPFSTITIYYYHDPKKSFLDDPDGDGLTDKEEIGFSDPTKADWDEDGLNDLEEKKLGTNPFSSDTDRDGLSDIAELQYGTDPTVSDVDGDGLSDGEEVDAGTDPFNSDTDGDGLSDDFEVHSFGFNPLKADSDGDRLPDFDENSLETDPSLPDTDGDGLQDGDEVGRGTNPKLRDTDNDGLSDLQELQHGTDPLVADEDNDNFNDRDEIMYGTNPLVADQDGDDWNDFQEKAHNTNPFVADTDGDGLIDSVDNDPIYNDADSEQISYPWNSSAIPYFTINGDSQIRADGVSSGTYQVTLYGNENADKAVQVAASEPGTITDLSGGVTDSSGDFNFKYTPEKSLAGNTYAELTVTIGEKSVSGNVYLTAPGISIDVLSMPSTVVGYSGKFKFKVTDDTQAQIEGLDIVLEIINGTATYTFLSPTEFEGEWTPESNGRFPLEIRAGIDGLNTSHTTITAIAGVSPLQIIVDKIIKYVPFLAQFDAAGAEHVRDAIDTMNISYYVADTDVEGLAEKQGIQNQAAAIFQLIRAYVEINREVERVAGAGTELLLPLFSLDFALDYAYGKLANVPAVNQLIGSAKSLSNSVFATLYSKLGATAGTKDVLGMMQEKMEEVVTTSFKGATSTAIKEEIEKAVNDALKEQVTLAIVQGVMGSAATGFQANINTLLNTSNPNVTAWRDDAVNRLAEVRQVALIHTRSEGAMNTISSTSDAVGNAADLLSMSLSATGIGAAPGVFVKAVSSALSTLKSTAQTVNGLNYGLTLSKMAAWGGANPSSSSSPSSSSFLRYAYRAMPLQASFALPENFHPGTVLAQSNTAMSLLGQQAAAGLLSEFLSGVGNFSATLEESAFPLSQVSEYVFDQAASGNITADQGVLLIDTFLDLSLNQLSNAGYLMDALVRWDDVDSRYGVMAQAYESAAILTDNTETLNGISTTIVPAVFSPAISAITYPQTPLVFGSQFTIQVTVDNSSDVAGSTLLTLGTYDTSPERLADVTRSLRVISNLVVNPEDLPTDSNGDGRVGLAEAVNYLGQIEKYTLKETIETVDLAAQGSVNITFGPFAVERLQQEFLIGVNGRSIRVLGVQGYQDGIPPVLMSRFPTPDEILPDPPGFITVFIENGTGSGEIQSGQLFLGGQKVGDVTTGGIHTFAVSSLISSGGEYDVSLVLQTAAGEHPENWSFTVVGN